MCAIKKTALLAGLMLNFFGINGLHAEQMQAEAIEAWAAEKVLVIDLMKKEGQRLASLSLAEIKEIRPTSINHEDVNSLSLTAMYGVGQNILAEVSFNGHNYLYLRGQTWPLGDELGKSQLRLLNMSSQCVLLAYKEQQHNLCVIPNGGQQ